VNLYGSFSRARIFKGVELDAWILAGVLYTNGLRKYSYEIACIIINYNMLLHYSNCMLKDSFICQQIERYKKALEECLKTDKERKIIALKEYVQKYKLKYRST